MDDKLQLNVNCVANNFDNAMVRKAVDQFTVDEACEVAVEPFVAADKFVAEAEARHKSAFLSQNMAQKDPEKKMPSTESKCNDPFGKTGIGGITPCEGPGRFEVNTWDCLGGVEDM